MRPLLVLPLTILLAAIALLAAPPARAQDETVQAIPTAVTPEAVLEARGQTFRAGTYFLSIRIAGAGPVRQSAPLSPDATGVVAARLLIGSLGVGNYSLVLSAGTPTGVALASTPLTIIPAMSVRAIPDPARAGDPLQAEISGQRGGSVQLLLEGEVVAGPVTAQTGTMLLPFTLPSGLAPGTSAALEVRNFDGEQLIGLGRGSLRVATIPFTGAARLVNLAGLASVLEINRPFDITGRVELRRGTPQGLQARLVARLPGGRTLVLDDGRGVVAANGDFRIRGTPPSSWNGAPVVLSQLGTGQGDFAIVLVDPAVGDGRRGATFTFPQGPRSFSDPDAAPAEIGLNVRVRDPNGQPVPDVVVTLFGEPGGQLVAEDPAMAARGGAGATTSSPTLIRAGTQFGQVLQQVAPAILEKLRFECPISLFRNKTDVGGNVQVRLTPLALLLAQTESLNADIIDSSPDHDASVPLATSLRLRLSPLGAGTNGFTFAAASNIAQAAETYLTYDHPNRRLVLRVRRVRWLHAVPARRHDPHADLHRAPVYRPDRAADHAGAARPAQARSRDRHRPLWPDHHFPGQRVRRCAGDRHRRWSRGRLYLRPVAVRHPAGGAPEPSPARRQRGRVSADGFQFAGLRQRRRDQYRAIVPAGHQLAWTGVSTAQKHRFDISVRSGSRNGGYAFLLDAMPPPTWWRERRPTPCVA